MITLNLRVGIELRVRLSTSLTLGLIWSVNWGNTKDPLFTPFFPCNPLIFSVIEVLEYPASDIFWNVPLRTFGAVILPLSSLPIAVICCSLSIFSLQLNKLSDGCTVEKYRIRLIRLILVRKTRPFHCCAPHVLLSRMALSIPPYHH